MILRDIFTGKDGITHDIGRYMAAVSFATGLGLEIYSVAWKNQPFDIQAFGIGIAALATGVGAMLKLKSETEPECISK